MEASAVPRAAPTGVTGVASPQLLRLASDARLVVLVRQGWPAAFEAVYNRHHRGILSFCRHVLSDADEAEDAVQHTFLAAYNDLIGSDKPIHLRAWLFTIARNRCYSILRARREQPAADLDERVTEGLATQVQRRQDLRDLVVDLRGLPDEQRAALVLAELDALSHEEIGEALGVPREKVKALVFQARESLVASRTARETACADIREQLSHGRGGALRRANLRRHLRDCSACRDFRRHVERQRRQIAALLPVVPTLALKEAVLTGTGSVGFGGGGLLASSALKSGLFKGFATLMLATAGTAGTYVATHDFHTRPSVGGAARSQPDADPATVSTAGLDPTVTVRRAVAPAASKDHAGSMAAPELRGLDAVRLTTPAQAGNGVLKPFGPLVHSRFPFPRKHVSRRQAIAPPKSTGKAPIAAPAAPVTVSSIPAATITSTSPPAAPVAVKPVTDPASSTGSLPGTSTSSAGRPHSLGRPAGRSTRPRAVGGRVSQAAVPTRAPSVRAAGHPAGRPASRGRDDGGSPGQSNGLPGSKSAPVGGRPRGSAGPAGTTTGSTADPAVGAGRLPSLSTMVPGLTTIAIGGNGSDPSGGTGGRGGSAIPS